MYVCIYKSEESAAVLCNCYIQIITKIYRGWEARLSNFLSIVQLKKSRRVSLIFFDSEFFIYSAFGVLVLIILTTIFKIAALSGGGGGWFVGRIARSRWSARGGVFAGTATEEDGEEGHQVNTAQSRHRTFS